MYCLGNAHCCVIEKVDAHRDYYISALSLIKLISFHLFLISRSLILQRTKNFNGGRDLDLRLIISRFLNRRLKKKKKNWEEVGERPEEEEELRRHTSWQGRHKRSFTRRRHIPSPSSSWSCHISLRLVNEFVDSDLWFVVSMSSSRFLKFNPSNNCNLRFDLCFTSCV